MTIREKYATWRACPLMPAELASELQTLSDGDLQDRFCRDLAFGTGGLRGVLGAGSNRMNLFTVLRATRGLGDYLLHSFSSPACAVGYDSRIHSRDFAEWTAAALAAMGIRVYLYPHLQPTPMLSYAVRFFHASAGVMITASHNPAEYNGYKVYGPDGCQITPAVADRIQDFIHKQEELPDTLPDFQGGLASGLISWIGEEAVEAYYQEVLKLQVHPCAHPLHVVYSPLNGTGNIPVREILKRLGNIRVDVVPEQELPDGRFLTCPSPNPENREAMSLAIRQTVASGADLCFATDPDCDRMGAGIRVGREVVLISGNDMGILMLDHLCQHLPPSAPDNPSRVVIKTIVTTDMAASLCRKYHLELRDVLTGFKYIGEQIGLLEREGCVSRFLFGFEESYGCLSGTAVRDKDAVNAALLLCEIAAGLKAEGKTLLDRLQELRSEFGFFTQRLLSFSYEGEDGARRMASVMASLRQPECLQEVGFAPLSHTDYLSDPTGLPASNVLSFTLTGNRRLVVRPSGTEPKLKAYLFARGESESEAVQDLNQMEIVVKRLCEI